jgi:hypothetical protein
MIFEEFYRELLSVEIEVKTAFTIVNLLTAKTKPIEAFPQASPKN